MAQHVSRMVGRFMPAAAAALCLLAALPMVKPAHAQVAPAAQAPGEEAPVTLPTLVGRLARVSGPVSFHTANEDQWQNATLNYPVTAGDAFWTQPDARAAIEFDNTRIAMDGSTEFEIATADDSTLQAIQPQGKAFIHLRTLSQGQSMMITTPRGTVSLLSPGRYEITAGDTSNPTLVSVLDGRAQVTGPGLNLTLGGGQTGVITGQQSFSGSITTLTPDPFLAAQLARETPPAPPVQATPGGPFGAAPPPMVAQMTGGADLMAIGSWSTTPEYGAVWYPPVAADWVPYREGHWAYVAPWGWTWIDSDPWGFAPFHYGRWVMVGPRWAWVPVVSGPAYAPPPYARPIYAPALVSFFHVGVNLGGVAIGITAGAIAGGSIGWVPLGPREIYYPAFRASPAYVRQVNIYNAPEVTRIINVNRTVIIQRNVTFNNFVNRRAVTVVPAGVMVSSRPVRPAVRPLPPGGLAGNARPVFGQVPVRPTVATLGMTPNVARRLNIVPAGKRFPARPPAPGPRIVARPMPPQRTFGRPVPPPRPTLRPASPYQSPQPRVPRPQVRHVPPPATPRRDSNRPPAPVYRPPAPRPPAPQAHRPPAVVRPAPTRPSAPIHRPPAPRPPEARPYHPPPAAPHRQPTRPTTRPAPARPPAHIYRPPAPKPRAPAPYHPPPRVDHNNRPPPHARAQAEPPRKKPPPDQKPGP